mmetsp:Transcript_1108/g.3794  ORF Transcript_1108/g.3794 Transcript_1108/m.3794 type:complete len:144 (+) Transcript_1108:332-763(+)
MKRTHSTAFFPEPIDDSTEAKTEQRIGFWDARINLTYKSSRTSIKPTQNNKVSADTFHDQCTLIGYKNQVYSIDEITPLEVYRAHMFLHNALNDDANPETVIKQLESIELGLYSPLQNAVSEGGKQIACCCGRHVECHAYSGH